MTPISPILRHNVVVLAKAYAKGRDIKLETVSRHIRGDMRFLDNFMHGRVTVTAKTYDNIIKYFHEHWPDDTPMPTIREMEK